MQPTGEFQPATPVVQREKSSKGLVLVTLFLALCTLVLGGLYCYEKFIAKDDEMAIADTSEQKDKCEEPKETGKIDGIDKEEILGVATADTDLEVRNLIRDIKNALIEGFKVTINEWGGYTTASSYTTYDENDLPVVIGENKRTDTEKSYGVVVESFPEESKSKATNDGVTEMLKETFAKYKLKDVSGPEYTGFYVGPDPKYFENEDGMVCMMSAGEHRVSIRCANKNWISEEKKELIEALFEAASKADEEATEKFDIDYLDATVEDIEDGENGAQRIAAETNNAVAVFYRNDSKSDWKLFTVTQGVRECGSYDTDELKNAFAGTNCYNEAAKAFEEVK